MIRQRISVVVEASVLPVLSVVLGTVIVGLALCTFSACQTATTPPTTIAIQAAPRAQVEDRRFLMSRILTRLRGEDEATVQSAMGTADFVYASVTLDGVTSAILVLSPEAAEYVGRAVSDQQRRDEALRKETERQSSTRE